ncbi:MAG: hypothetical protein HY705_02380 [Gemmatimonadetes bacterium]|nr:hypothetical protein [Gemmatimonadota bacterium]
MTTELSSGAISSILEAVPGIATVLRSPVADAIVNLSRAGAGLAPFDPKDAHELIRYAVRRGLIRSDEGDRVAAEIDAATESKGRAAASHTPVAEPKRPGVAKPRAGKRPAARKKPTPRRRPGRKVKKSPARKRPAARSKGSARQSRRRAVPAARKKTERRARRSPRAASRAGRRAKRR